MAYLGYDNIEHSSCYIVFCKRLKKLNNGTNGFFKAIFHPWILYCSSSTLLTYDTQYDRSMAIG